MNKTEIYFNPQFHKYTDNWGNNYTSVTTKIGEFEHKFDADKVSRFCAGKGRYVGMTPSQVKAAWKKESQTSANAGTIVHEFLEQVVNKSTGYVIPESFKINSERVITIEDIYDGTIQGSVNMDTLRESQLDIKYPIIYNVINSLTSAGFKLFTEVAVFDRQNLVCGRLDKIFINFDTKSFIIGDYKTNKADILPNQDYGFKNKSGYFKKDMDGNLTNTFIQTNECFKTPISHLQQSTFNKYGLQLSTYAHLAEIDGFTCIGLLLFHIKNENSTIDYKMDYLKEDVIRILSHNKKYNEVRIDEI